MSEQPGTCPECGAATAGGFHFCPSCGIRLLAREEPARGEAAPPSDPTDAPGPAVPDPADARRAERRLVSVLFVDLVGFTTLSEQLDPEDVREMQSRYFELARSTIARYGGSLEKFIGDAVMAVWGSPVARENDAERAVRAALDLLRNVASMAATPATASQTTARAAVTTGEAAVSFDVEGEGMVTGDMVNTASRLQEAAVPGTVLVDDGTRRAVADAVRFESVGEKALKGKASAVRAWRAVEVVGPEATESAAGHRGPFVGRGREMGSLEALAQSVREERRTTLVSIIGVAGIGKSRLGRELERSLLAGPGTRWYRGRPPRWGRGNAFAPLAEMLRRSLGVGEQDPAEVVRRTLREALHRLIDDEAERSWIEPRVRVLLDPSEQVQTERDELFAAWRRFLEADAAAGLLVLVFEDGQWADAETLDFIEYLATWSRRQPILALVLARPELLEARPTWGAAIPQFRSMHLEPLADAEVDELLRALAPGLPVDVIGRVRRRAEGVPLYAVEFARMMTERGLEADIPVSLHALLAARIDALPERERSMLLMAAVLGRRFRLEALAALSGMARPALGETVGTLVRREFLAMDDEPASPGRGQLSFVQDLAREVAYGTLSRRDRRRFHLAVIEHLESEQDPSVIEQIAEHLVAAHAIAGAGEGDRDVIGTRARDALRQAADHAAALHAPHRALAHLERALSLTEEPRLRADMAEAAARSARAAARFGAAERYLREAIDLRQSLNDATAATRDRAQLASVLLQAQRSDAALAELERAWEVYSASGDTDAGLSHLAAELARAHMLRGQTSSAVEWAERAIAHAEPAGESAIHAVDARVSMGTALAQGGQPEEGLGQLRRALDEAVSHGLASIELRARTNLAWLMAGDDPRAAAETARRGLEVARQMGSREWWLQLLDIAGFIAIDTGEWEAAIRALDEVDGTELPTAYRLDFAAMRAVIDSLRGAPDALAPLDRLGDPEPDLDPHALAWLASARATAAMVHGDQEKALGLARSAAAGAVGLERAEALALAGRIAIWSGRLDDASSVLAELEREVVWGRAAELRVRTLRLGVEELGTRQPEDEADESWDAVLAAWRSLELPYREALCLADRWVLLGNPADRGAATRIFDRLGASAMVAVLGTVGVEAAAASPPRGRRSSRGAAVHPQGE